MTGFIFGPLQQAFHGGPDELPALPPEKKDPAPMAADPKTPGNLPGSEDKTQAATIADEKRRILKTIPTKTKTTYAGADGEAPVVKKRLLGAAIGKQTTGE